MGLFGKKQAAAPPPVRPAAAPAPAPPNLYETSFKMKMTAKQLGRHAAKAKSQVTAEEKKAEAALRAGNVEGARIHAQAAIRNKTQANSYMKLQSQLEGIASQVQAAHIRGQVMGNINAVNMQLEQALGAQNLEEAAKIMDTFETNAVDMDVTSGMLDSTIGSSMASSTPADEVDELLTKMAVAQNIEVNDEQGGLVVPAQDPGQKVGGQDDLEARFKALTDRQP